MSKYIVETFYTCSFKIVHELDELNALLNLEDEEIYNFYQNNTTSKNLTNNKMNSCLL